MREGLEKWETPFSDVAWPSVFLVASAAGTKAFVAPHGIDSYPKFVVDFGPALMFRSFDEACALGFGYKIEFPKGCSFVWRGSTWLESYAPCHDPFGNKHFAHYLIN